MTFCAHRARIVYVRYEQHIHYAHFLAARDAEITYFTRVYIRYIQIGGVVFISVNSSSNEPIYKQIIRQVRDHIISGKIEPGEILPSIRNMAKELGISVITTKRAYEELEKQGLVESVGGKGTFVTSENGEFIREKRVHQMEEKLAEVIKESKMLNIGLQGLKMMVEVLYRDEVI